MSCARVFSVTSPTLKTMAVAMPMLSRDSPANSLSACARCDITRSQPSAARNASAGTTGKMYPTSFELGIEKNTVMAMTQIQHRLVHSRATAPWLNTSRAPRLICASANSAHGKNSSPMASK